MILWMLAMATIADPARGMGACLPSEWSGDFLRCERGCLVAPANFAETSDHFGGAAEFTAWHAMYGRI